MRAEKGDTLLPKTIPGCSGESTYTDKFSGDKHPICLDVTSGHTGSFALAVHKKIDRTSSELATIEIDFASSQIVIEFQASDCQEQETVAKLLNIKLFLWNIIIDQHSVTIFLNGRRVVTIKLTECGLALADKTDDLIISLLQPNDGVLMYSPFRQIEGKQQIECMH